MHVDIHTCSYIFLYITLENKCLCIKTGHTCAWACMHVRLIKYLMTWDMAQLGISTFKLLGQHQHILVRKYDYIYIHIYTCIWMHVYVWMHPLICNLAYMCIHWYVRMHYTSNHVAHIIILLYSLHIHVHMHVHTYNAYAYAYYIIVNIHVHIHIYMYTCAEHIYTDSKKKRISFITLWRTSVTYFMTCRWLNIAFL